MANRRDPGDGLVRGAPNGGKTMDRRAMLARASALLLSSIFGWPAPAHARRAGTVAPWNPEMEVAITFQIGDPRSVAARKPYVTVYVETPDGKAVRTIVLWAQKQIAWLRQLRYWYRGELARQRAEGGNLVSTLTSATRRPGTYTVVWDGRDNAGNYVEQGRYAVVIETIRQNAGNHMVREEFTFGGESFREEVEPYASLGDIVIEYRAKAS